MSSTRNHESSWEKFKKTEQIDCIKFSLHIKLGSFYKEALNSILQSRMMLGDGENAEPSKLALSNSYYSLGKF